MSVSVPVDYLVAIVQTVVVEFLAVAEQVALVAAAAPSFLELDDLSPAPLPPFSLVLPSLQCSRK